MYYGGCDSVPWDMAEFEFEVWAWLFCEEEYFFGADKKQFSLMTG